MQKTSCNRIAFKDLGPVFPKHAMKITSLTCLAPIALAALLPSAHAALAWTSGHGDIGVEYEGGGDLHLHLHLGEEEPAIVGGNTIIDQEFDADEVDITVPAAAEVVLSSNVPFLGAFSGQSIWLLPQDGDAAGLIGAPFVGWGTEALNPADWVGNLQFKLVSVTSPSGSGHFAVWQLDGFGSLSKLAMSTADPGADVVSQAADIHDHYNIGFTERGIWTVGMRIEGNHVTDGFASGIATYTFNVVPEPSTALLGGLGLLMVFRRRR
jgi:hypothetical protein